jgi:hypothetical protein
MPRNTYGRLVWVDWSTTATSIQRLCMFRSSAFIAIMFTLRYSTPETFDIVPSTIDVSSRKNLAQISRVLTQITTGTEFSENAPCYIPINDYVRKAIEQLGSWFIEGTWLIQA